MTDYKNLRFFWGSSSGSSHKALRLMEEPHVMMSATSDVTHTWDGIGELFVDSGGYSLMSSVGEHPPLEEYLDTAEHMGGDYVAVQDYPCEPDILEKLDRTVADHQEMTTENTIDCLDALDGRAFDAEPVTVLQGWTPGDYLDHLDQLYDHGCMTQRVGIGSVCGRENADEIRAIIDVIAREVPDSVDLHGFGIKITALHDRRTRDALYSADSAAWCHYPYKHKLASEPAFRTFTGLYLDYWRRLADRLGERDE